MSDQPNPRTSSLLATSGASFQNHKAKSLRINARNVRSNVKSYAEKLNLVTEKVHSS